LLLLLIAPTASFAQDAQVKEILAKNTVTEKNICGAVIKAIHDEVNTRTVVNTAIKLGHSTCLVVKCAVKGGGKLEDIVIGATDAGASTDVVSKCAIDGGADPLACATALNLAVAPNVCYFFPQGLGVDFLPEPDAPVAPRSVSPSSF
jgi:hypothetical protein